MFDENQHTHSSPPENTLVPAAPGGLDGEKSLLAAYNLALGLESRAKYAEALTFARRSEDGWRRTVGAGHVKTKGAERVRRRIEAILKNPER